MEFVNRHEVDVQWNVSIEITLSLNLMQTTKTANGSETYQKMNGERSVRIDPKHVLCVE